MTITESAVVQRIRRKLRNTMHMLRKSRGERRHVDCGRYYVLDTEHNSVAWQRFNLETYARDLGVLRPDETWPNENSYGGTLAPGFGQNVSTVDNQPVAQPGQLANERSKPW